MSQRLIIYVIFFFYFNFNYAIYPHNVYFQKQKFQSGEHRWKIQVLEKSWIRVEA